MTLPIDPSYPIANLRQILSDRAKLDLSPIELAEILWLAVQRGEAVVTDNTPNQPSDRSSSVQPSTSTDPESSGEHPSLPPEVNVDIVVKPPSPSPKPDKPLTPLPVKIPEAVALRHRREIAKVLRPLMRKVPSSTRQAIDEEATAMRIAEDKIWNPVVKPEPERWLELAIVIEVTNLFDVWHESIAEFQHLMERHGAFRDVRTWQLQTPENGQPQLFSQTATGLNRKPRSPRELLAAGGRRLVLFLSDCTSKAWRSGQIFQLLELWSRENPVTIGQLLPERYWDRSALGSGYLVALRSQLPGARSRDWKVSGLSPRRRHRLPGGLKFPVVTIQPRSLGEWARAVAAVGEQQTTGIVLTSDAFQADRVADSGAETLTAKQLVQRFRGTASERAQELADMMAVLPVNWSVLRLLQKNLMQEIEDPAEGTGALYLAEIFLSGLLCSVKKPEPNLTATRQYDFVEGVRDVLLGAIPISEAREVGEEIATVIFKQLPAEVQERVNADIARRWGESLSYFEAFLLPDLPWGEDAAAEMLPFAQVTGDVLRRWGGEYAVLAEKLEQTRGSQSPQVVEYVEPKLESLNFYTAQLVEAGSETYPPLQSEEYTVATIAFDSPDQPTIELEPFNFKVGTLVKSGNTWEVQKSDGRAYRYVEQIDENVTLEMVAIAGGEFMMGSPAEEPDRFDDESQQHLVTVPDFYLGRYPVTQAQWRAVAAMPQVERELNPDPSTFKGDTRPVEQVSWFDAIEFCARLSKHTKRQYRLPSEAEWEYACRAGTTTPFHFGETISTELANYNGSAYADGPTGKSRSETTPVDHFEIANAWGLCDMHGNVWEWCQDHWHDNYDDAPKDGSAWLTDNADATRVRRGGSWINNPGNCRSAYRINYNPGDRLDFIGFRVACAAPGLL